MKYIVYIDVFFVVNLVMDSILLKLAAHYIKPQTTIVRCAAGGATGSFIACVSLWIPFDNMVLRMVVSYVFTAAAMVYVTYGKCSLKLMIKRVASLYFVTIFTGGAMNLIYNYTYFGYMIRGIFSTVFHNPINLLKMCLFTSMSYVLLRRMLGFIEGVKKKNHFVIVKLFFKDKSVMVKGLIDSGNGLMDPYCHKPVHIVEYSAINTLLEGADIHKEKYRLVPFHSLGKRNGLLEVIEFEKLAVYEADSALGDMEESLYEEERPAIGLYYSNLSAKNEFVMLLNGSIKI